MQKITIALICIAILLINSVSVSVHAFENVGIHTHVYTHSVDADDTTLDLARHSQRPVQVTRPNGAAQAEVGVVDFA